VRVPDRPAIPNSAGLRWFGQTPSSRRRRAEAREGKYFNGIPGVEAYGFGPFHEFDDFDQLLAGLDIGNVVLSAFQALGEFNLRRPASLRFSTRKSRKALCRGESMGRAI
jgi:hypothetical protein